MVLFCKNTYHCLFKNINITKLYYFINVFFCSIQESPSYETNIQNTPHNTIKCQLFTFF